MKPLLAAVVLACCATLGGPRVATPEAAPPVVAPVVAPGPVPLGGPPYVAGDVLAPRTVGEPTRLLIPAVGVDEHLDPVGLKPDGAMQTPDFGDAGWYRLGPRPGAAGPAVVVAHVHGPGGDDVFARLHTLRRGDRVTVRRADGAAVFVVERVERARKTALPYARIWNRTTQPELRLITCGGRPDPVTRMYPDNTIVYARWVSSPRR